jgi:hypothetical protein
MSEPDYRTIGPVAAGLGMPRWQLAYLIERGEVPGPSLVVPGRRLFTDADVENIRLALTRRRARTGRRGERRADRTTGRPPRLPSARLSCRDRQ